MLTNLKSFHLFFIGAAIVLMAGFGMWGLLNGYTLSGVIALIVGAALIVYGGYFAGKARSIPNTPFRPGGPGSV